MPETSQHGALSAAELGADGELAEDQPALRTLVLDHQRGQALQQPWNGAALLPAEVSPDPFRLFHQPRPLAVEPLEKGGGVANSRAEGFQLSLCQQMAFMGKPVLAETPPSGLEGAFPDQARDVLEHVGQVPVLGLEVVPEML